ncbi:CPBP family intramembrane glutamic endopeptidase [Schumannella sp. 10F1B-5-1]|uniref:CPBP family intramembrane glutamic endopeptidase n=1 Tax=Schumannella sp. 10F1B-5-1 TaxID=2590780 RepID=UPI0011301D5F|nr:CPBP family intramembrane glutamic endopeptidase [Schumannella sp. 10F1B-5-1]TPW73110.1 CPBP family intramembrane metalloprotease [Schumannella sp. 10F1B-5-1]
MSRARIHAEVAIVLGLSLGLSALYAIVQLIDASTRGPLRDQTTTLNPSRSDREIFDLLYQLLSIAGDLVPVALVCFLLWSASRPHLGRLGIDFTKPGRDALQGLGLAVVIGAGGIGVYLGARALGLAVGVQANGLSEHWWTIPVLLLSAFRAGATEEIIVIGYLFARLGQAGWNRWAIIVSAALFRASYHLYQGWGGFVGNLIMGLIFGWLYSRTKRVLPLVIAHTIIDAVVFVGYPWAAATFPQLFGV